MPNLSLFDLTGKKALVTGGSTGIGRACATALAMAGADVAISTRNSEIGSKSVESLKLMGVNAFSMCCDISDKQQIEAMIQSVVKGFGRLDIAVNNAGFGIPPGNSEHLEKCEWDRVIGVNLTGTFLCAQAQSQQMIKQNPAEGKIINIASMYASIAAGNCSYSAAKAGVVHLTKTLAAEWGRFNINVNCISPSWTMTPGMSNTPERTRARMREVTPMGHLQRPEDIYGAVLFLASEASNYVTGHDLVVDGGHTLSTWLEPLERIVSPRINPEQENFEMDKDLDSLNGA